MLPSYYRPLLKDGEKGTYRLGIHGHISRGYRPSAPP